MYYLKGRAQNVQRALTTAKQQGLSVRGNAQNHQISGNLTTLQQVAGMYNCDIHKVVHVTNRYIPTTYKIVGKQAVIRSMTDFLKSIKLPNFKGHIKTAGVDTIIHCKTSSHQEVLIENVRDYGLSLKPI